MTFRSAIPDFQLANPLYAGAVVSFWTVDVNGEKTATLAPLFAGPTGIAQVPNPQILDAEGKFPVPVYHSVPVIAEVESDASDTVETGIILPYAAWGGNWTTATLIDGNKLLRDPNNLSIYIATTTFVTSGSIPNDVAAGNLELVFQGEAATIASDAAAAAEQAAADAEAALVTMSVMLDTVARTQAAGTTNGIIMQSGTTGQRVTPGAGVVVVRYNTTTAKMEMYVGSWGAFIRNLGEIGNVDMASIPPVSGDGLVFDGTNWKPGPAGGGMFRGNNGTVGSRKGDIFRVNAQTLTATTTIAADENASASGPLTIDTGITLTVSAGGTLVIL